MLRWCLGGQLLYFGFGKVIPIQMPRPALATLLTPYGDMTPMSVLWNQVGLSQPYEILLGAAEVLAGLMLFIPRTAILGAMLALVDMSMVFVENMAFGVPVRLWAAHLLLASLVLLAPEARRLVGVLVLDRPAGRSTAPTPFRAPRSRRIAALVQLVLAVWIGVGLVHSDWTSWRQHGSDRPQPPLYGIWTVEQFTRDGQVVPPLLTDPNRWQRIVVDDPGVLDYQRMDGTLVPALLHVDLRTRRLDLRTAPVRGHPAAPQAGTFTFVQSSADDLRLDGEVDGHPVTVTLRRFDEHSFPQRSQGFHWAQDHANH
ncbi:DoxX family protein [Nocardia alni]|uniref:DoxX family protein n=1 Tax=Nocardia alni TaxID=2815723 RepID=UPI001C228E60|nr:DoxX family protein [Nocardia alni]